MPEDARDARTWTKRKRYPRFRSVVIHGVKDPGVLRRHRVSESCQDFNRILCGAVRWRGSGFGWSGCGWRYDLSPRKVQERHDLSSFVMVVSACTAVREG
jgi:hypothetical protein